ncbi:LPS translocon maturation chaperone LptM [Otariodibacter oris]|uniref:Putative small lipoprotein YifL n=1 Tax=Otariodibacter oris TaxID=1032623 RepID=A0A420XFJ2_9PAST|nr:lipoprotein [Otariodibacter oris]RKR71268.1 putative small lipoprotein YifL [Otariodibacter oris]
MKKFFFMAVLASFMLTACGVKGPLYFPEQPSETQTES